jgi:chromosome segregation protein
MQITQIRIAGFKSFVDPTDVPVEEGLTGIVGPNGCGKSNLLEALRWAMGASSARAMRGSEMDDLIFSGSDGRPARETAEVTLVLDNSDRKAPAEFNSADVLEIERRLRRGIGSTYKLNGRTVRGKDIQLLFADASTGANSPALVRQGQISELIGSKPQNRRRILEEAAGIAGLNTRRHDAELKLRGAETNLERLSEVSAEVERQLERLKRQARKARKFRALSNEVAGLEALTAHLRWSAAKDARETTAQALQLAKRAVEDATREDTVKETERLRTHETLTPLREAESLVSAKLGQARIAFARLDAEHKAATQAITQIEQDVERLTEDLAREHQMLTEAKEAKARTQAELDGLPLDDDAANSAREEDARKALEAARTHLTQCETETDLVSSKLAQMRAHRQAAQDNLQTLAQRESILRTEAGKLEAEFNAIGDTASLQATLTSARTHEEQVEIALHDIERALDNSEADLTEAKDAEEAAGVPVSEMEQALRALEGEISGLERLLRRAETSKAPPVLDRVRTRDGYEKAIAAALGDDLQAPTDKSAPLHWAGANSHGLDLPAGATPLGDLTDAPDELAARLAQCGLVSAEDGAALAKGLQPGQRLVSVEGHLWRWDGFVRTPAAPVIAAEQLEQKARLAAARKELPPLKAKLGTAREELTAAKETRREKEQNHRDLRAERPKASKALDDARRQSASALQAHEHAQIRRESAQTALNRTLADLRFAAEALAAANMTPEDTSFEHLEQELVSKRAELATARESEMDLRGKLGDLTRGREQAAARREGLQRDLEEWTRRIGSTQARHEGLLARKSETQKRLSAARNGDEGKQAEQLSELQLAADKLEEDRKQAADQLAEAETKARQAEAESRAATAQAAKSRETLAGAAAMLEASETRFSECVEIARQQFQRLPEGLLPLAQSMLDEEMIAGMDQSQASQKADLLKRERDSLGGVNMDAESEAEELAERLGSQAHEKNDLLAAIAKLREGVETLNAEGRDRLLEAFETVNEHFKALFTALFRGGQAELRLIDAEDPLAAGLEIFAQPPGKKLGTLQLMSGGEQALTAAALIFAVFLSNPAPVCVLDEVDAPLDDANVDRFCRMLDEMRNRTNTRFIIITHNPVTMSRMDRLFGVTMREKGVSKLVSVDLNAAEELVAAE